MTPEQYTKATMDTAVYPEAGLRTTREVNYLVHGLVGEAGELANVFKKLIRNGLVPLDERKRFVIPFDQQNKLLDELGDVLWYLTRLSVTLESSLPDVMKRNVEKLQSRKVTDTLKNHT